MRVAVRTLLWNEYKERAVVLFFCGSKSYTGEDLVEFQLHGNPLLVRHFIEHLFSLGIRLAEPGEFTRRALLNGKQNLIEVEALRDLINATVDTQLRQAQAMSGGLPGWICKAKDMIAPWLALAEADIDYGEDNEIINDIKILQNNLLPLKSLLDAEYKRALAAKWLVGGIRVALVGSPNAGKSTLFNAMIGDDRAIVTNIPGTTRDVLEAYTDWAGLPLFLFDTAGLRHSEDPIELLGIARVYDVLERSDLILYLIPITDKLPDQEIMERLAPFVGKVMIVRNKIDLVTELTSGTEPHISVVNGNLTSLATAIRERFLGGFAPDACLGAMATKRQRDLLKQLILQIDMLFLLDIESPPELAASVLQGAWSLLLQLTGEDRADTTLDKLFSEFCLGK
jgi:tRNA modification GTPase